MCELQCEGRASSDTGAAHAPRRTAAGARKRGYRRRRGFHALPREGGQSGEGEGEGRQSREEEGDGGEHLRETARSRVGRAVGWETKAVRQKEREE